jgi:hypothetical protein
MLTTATEALCHLGEFPQQMQGQYPKLGHDHFLPYLPNSLFTVIISNHFANEPYIIQATEICYMSHK